ncbi:Cro/CI family transcriptional regulator [Atlantibacter hermannii]|uniref:Cro/CI family transcriptional regulator n=1 Tax=Atlantibacter hermannii TaxID=565 RepID=UPI003B434073
MYKKDVVQHFGSQRAVARALGLSESAVSQWKSVIPENDAFKLEAITSGALKRNPDLYNGAA